MSAKHKPLPQAGEVCKSCVKLWEAQKLVPKRLVTVFDIDGKPMTTDKGLEIIICPYCDGDVILKLDKTESEVA